MEEKGPWTQMCFEPRKVLISQEPFPKFLKVSVMFCHLPKMSALQSHSLANVLPSSRKESLKPLGMIASLKDLMGGAAPGRWCRWEGGLVCAEGNHLTPLFTAFISHSNIYNFPCYRQEEHCYESFPDTLAHIFVRMRKTQMLTDIVQSSGGLMLGC